MYVDTAGVAEATKSFATAAKDGGSAAAANQYAKDLELLIEKSSPSRLDQAIDRVVRQLHADFSAAGNAGGSGNVQEQGAQVVNALVQADQDAAAAIHRVV